MDARVPNPPQFAGPSTLEDTINNGGVPEINMPVVPEGGTRPTYILPNSGQNDPDA